MHIMSNPGKNPGQPRLGAVIEPPEVPDPFAVEDPFPLPLGVKAGTTNEDDKPPMRLEDIKALRVRDRGEEIKAGAAGSPRPAVAAEESRLRTQNAVGEASDDDDGPTPEEMALYWEAVKGELEPPRGMIVYPDIGTSRLIVAKTYRGAPRDDVAMIALALVGDTKHVPFEAFQAHLHNARVASGKIQAPPHQELPPVEGEAIGVDATVGVGAKELLEAIGSELDTILQTRVMQGGDDPMPTQDEEIARLGEDGRRSMALGQGSDQGDAWDVNDQSSRIGLARARPGDRFTARRLQPRVEHASRRPEPAPAPATPEVTPTAAKKRPAKKPPVLPRAAVGVLLLIVFSLIGSSLAYLQRETRGIRHEIGEERMRNDQQDIVIHELNNRTADVITALAREKARVVDLRRERDGYESLAKSVEETRKKDAEMILRANSGLKADIGRVRDQTARLETQVKSLQDELRRREAGDKTPSPAQ